MSKWLLVVILLIPMPQMKVTMKAYKCCSANVCLKQRHHVTLAAEN